MGAIGHGGWSAGISTSDGLVHGRVRRIRGQWAWLFSGDMIGLLVVSSLIAAIPTARATAGSLDAASFDRPLGSETQQALNVSAIVRRLPPLPMRDIAPLQIHAPDEDVILVPRPIEFDDRVRPVATKRMAKQLRGSEEVPLPQATDPDRPESGGKNAESVSPPPTQRRSSPPPSTPQSAAAPSVVVPTLVAPPVVAPPVVAPPVVAPPVVAPPVLASPAAPPPMAPTAAPPPAPPPSAVASPAEAPGAASPSSDAPPSVALAPNSPAPPAANNLVDMLIRRGDELLKLRDIAAARLLYERAALSGNAHAAMLAGKTYDPLFFAEAGVSGIVADRSKALEWYGAAAALGDGEAAARTEKLRNSRQQ